MGWEKQPASVGKRKVWVLFKPPCLSPREGDKWPVPLVSLLVNVVVGGVSLSHRNQIVFWAQYSAQIVRTPRKYLSHSTLN